jgi:hypothetical protein
VEHLNLIVSISSIVIAFGTSVSAWMIIPYRVKRIEVEMEELKRKSEERSDRLIRCESTLDQIRTDVTTILKKLK